MRLAERVHAYHRFWRFRLRAERPELAYMLRQNFAGGTLVDIGANRGAYAYWMHRAAGPAGRVVAFEPQPELVDYLGRLKGAFGLSRLSIIETALSDRSGEMSLVRPRAHWGAASFHLEERGNCDVLPVPVTTLDGYFAHRDVPRIRFIKCDVQDHEEQVLRGGARVLAEHQPTILLEQTDAQFLDGGVGEFFASLGYRGYFFRNRSLVSVDRWHELRGRIPAPFLNYLYRPAQRRVSVGCKSTGQC